MFGAEFLEEPSQVVEFFVETIRPYLAHKGKLSSVEASLLLHKAYLLRYNLTTKTELNHNPASLVRMRPAEDGYMGTLMEEHFEHFVDLEIYQFMKWDEYIRLPRSEINMVRRVAEKRLRRKNAVDDKSVKQAEDTMRSLGLGG